jgi:hypothetical protein
MLRGFVLALVFLNGVYFAWGQGWLLPYGFGPATQSEPQRLAQQIKPESIELLGSKEAEQMLAAVVSQRSEQCLQAGPFDDAQGAVLRRALEASLPLDAWTLESSTVPERWIVYMGKYANTAELDKKRAQLEGLRLTFEPLTNSTLAPGLSLGGFQTQSEAVTALAVLARRGVRTARVLQEQPSRHGYRLRLSNVDDVLRKQLATLKAVLAGKELTPC